MNAMYSRYKFVLQTGTSLYCRKHTWIRTCCRGWP